MRKNKNMKTKVINIKQKLLGIILIIAMIFTAIITGDGTASFMITPIGIWMLISKENLLSDGRNN